MESFFSIMKREVMDDHFNTKAELIRAMRHWIYFYNNYRMKGRPKGKSPVEYRELALQNASYQQVI
jgi:transposase InsO family protein